mmetsp:Transcript_34659/g.48279  ORF Transcript_34659/g.48279 Transcript_34659/m.48279 type:complete len:84 (+) Transcript_34659:269-520(+)
MQPVSRCAAGLAARRHYVDIITRACCNYVSLQHVAVAQHAASPCTRRKLGAAQDHSTLFNNVIFRRMIDKQTQSANIMQSDAP